MLLINLILTLYQAMFLVKFNPLYTSVTLSKFRPISTQAAIRYTHCPGINNPLMKNGTYSHPEIFLITCKKIHCKSKRCSGEPCDSEIDRKSVGHLTSKKKEFDDKKSLLLDKTINYSGEEKAQYALIYEKPEKSKPTDSAKHEKATNFIRKEHVSNKIFDSTEKQKS
jgi:hypothetical protein